MDDRTACELLERELALIDPSRDWGMFQARPDGSFHSERFGTDPHDYPDREAWFADFLARRRSFLEGRVAELTERKARQTLARVEASLGIGRFVGDGRYGLDELAEITRSDPDAILELSAQRVEQINSTREAEIKRVKELERV